MENSLSSSVKQAIENHPYIKYALDEGLVNYSALARKLAPAIEAKFGKKVNEESLIVAIKRYADSAKRAGSPVDIRELLGKSSLSMQDAVSYALIKRTPKSFDTVDSLFEETDWGFDEVRTLVGSASHLVVLLKSDRMRALLKKLDRDDIEELNENMALVTVKLPKEAFKMHGVLNEMTVVLAKNGVSIDLFCLPPETHFIVNEEDSEKTYKILKELVNESRRGKASE